MPTEPNEFYCPRCGMWFDVDEPLQISPSAHLHGFKCPNCGRKFRVKISGYETDEVV